MSEGIGDRLTSAERRVFFDVGVLMMIWFVGFELLWPGLTSQYAGWPLIGSLLVGGMPHGAVDLSVIQQLRRRHGVLQPRFLTYLFVLMLSAAFFVTAPLLAAGLFLALSGVHFGLADARALGSRFGVQESSTDITLTALTRGVLIISLPFAFHTTESLEVVLNVVAIAGANANWISEWPVRAMAVILVLTSLVVIVMHALRRTIAGRGRLSRIEWLETCVLAAAFCFLHPLFAMGLYVAAWHSWRHLQVTARFLRHGRAMHSVRDCVAAIGRLHLLSLALLVPTIASFMTIAWLRLESTAPEQLAALMIALFVVLTLPHHLLVERLVRSKTVGHDSPAAPAGLRAPLQA